jgi:SAM-dependent methyltransferase
MTATADELHSSVRLYTPIVLTFYDAFVLQFSSRAAWRFSAPRILELYNRHLSGNHLEIGVGTGYFLDKATFSTERPSVTLVDLNANTLAATSRRIARYAPRSIVANALEPITFESQFSTIGMNYVLHTMPGSMQDKVIALRHARSYLKEGGVLFGTTLLGDGVDTNPLARLLMRAYNRLKWFSNQQDTLPNLEQGLRTNFNRYEVRVIGPTAVFEAWA